MIMKKNFLPIIALALSATACVSDADLDVTDNKGFINVSVSADNSMETRDIQTVSDFSDWAIIQTADKPTVSVNDIGLNYKKSAALKPSVTVDENASYTVTYTSSNPSVARVDENGKVYGAKKGGADITVIITDEYGNTASDTCKVNVTYAWWQWIIVIVLFGWIWY